MKTHFQIMIFLFPVFLPLFAAAQTPTPTTGKENVPSLVEAQTPTTTATMDNSPNLSEQLKSAQKEVNQLTAERQDSTLAYNRIVQSYLEDLIREKAQEAKKAGRAKKAKELLRKIDDLEAAWQKGWDQDLVLLDKKSKIGLLNLDRLLEMDKTLSARYLANDNPKKAKEMDESLKFIQEMKDTENQIAQLGRDLITAREKYDFQAAAEIRQKLWDTREQINDKLKKMKLNLQKIDETLETNEQSL